MTLLEKTTRILSRAYGGEHHIPGKIKDNGHFIECNIFGGIATYDCNRLTRLVIGAHDECCRMEISPSGPGLIKLRFSERKRPEECGEYPLMSGHVTIEEAVQVYRTGGRFDQYFNQFKQRGILR